MWTFCSRIRRENSPFLPFRISVTVREVTPHHRKHRLHSMSVAGTGGIRPFGCKLRTFHVRPSSFCRVWRGSHPMPRTNFNPPDVVWIRHRESSRFFFTGRCTEGTLKGLPTCWFLGGRLGGAFGPRQLTGRLRKTNREPCGRTAVEIWPSALTDFGDVGGTL